ncbi:SdrD B-like domain-containing protein, partial [Runella zeae]|uniref:SdrD B-like domain-containing protein n=1 Tax=Runella zeae TaxID=94255 RepID=UPI0012FBBE22
MKTHLIDLTYTAPREQYTFQSEGRLWRWLGTLLVVMGCTLSVAQAQVSGKVFQDFNANGAQGTASPNLEPGYGGITVKAYDASGTQVATATTAADGTYTLTGVTGAVRVEFTGFPSYYYSGPKGTQNNTSVQFVTAPATNVNFGINYPVNYCQSNPNLATPCYVNGAASGTGDVLVSWPYSNSGTTGTVNHLATQTQIGSTYGLTYDRTGKQLYSSSWLKRHVGLPDLNNDSKGDLGNIYVTNTTTNATSLWLDLTTLGIDFGSIANDAGRGLGVLTAPSNDPTSFAMVGKAGIGDIDLSDDGKTLYLTNLFDKKLYAIDVATKTVISSWIVPQTCSNNDVVNMGLKYYQGNVYVGQVCTAETSQNTADLKATVYKFDGTSFTSVLSFPVNYTRGDAVYGPDAVCSSGSQWHAWATPPFQDCTPRGFGLIVYTQPILSDIEFDPVDGRMIVGLRDRYGDQTGRNNYATTGTAVYESVIGGEILGAIPDGAGGYILESAGKLGSLTGSTNGKGPGGGEFYNGENWTNGVGGHQETSMGGLAILPGRNEIALTAIDPVQSVSGGVIFLNETNGTRSNQFELFKSSGAETFGKANGLGDLELLCDPAPIEIGNRVWKDTDNDGIQDPDEPALAGVTVQLTDASGTLIATAITDANGNYIFSSAVGTSTTSTKYGLNLMPTTNYTLKVSSLGTDASVTGLTLTSVTIAPGETTSTNTGATLNNNDAFVSGGLPTINLKTGETGANNHTYDFGFTSVSSVFDLALRKTLAAGQAASVNPGSTVKFTITIYNQGNVDATAIQVSDYIPTGLTLNDANWSVSGGIATLNTPIGSLAAGASTTRDITFTVNAGFTGTAINKAEISSAIG